MGICLLFSRGEQTASRSPVYHVQALQESLRPVRPGEPGKRPFWNSRAVKFIYAPAFNFKPVEQAAAYRFTATSAVDGADYIFTAQQPWAAVTEVWRRLPTGYVQLKVEALDRQGKTKGMCGAKEFYKDAAFAGPYQSAALDYRASALAAWSHLFKQKHVQAWAQTGAPDPTYPLYCYPAKVIGAVVSSMARYARLAPADSTQAIAIARNAADYLIRISQPADSPLAYFPPTYHGEQLTAGAYAGQIMIPYAAEAAMYYLDLFDAVNDTGYLQAALCIAGTLKKIQLGSGTWYLKVHAESGQPVQENLSIPIAIIEFFDRLNRQYHIETYQAAADHALKWVLAHPAVTFNWEGQFEDVEPSLPYENLTKHQACSLALYLLDHGEKFPESKQLIADLLHFSEDLFVIWKKPFATALSLSKGPADDWFTPCVLEQYRCYLPVDASSAKMIESFSRYYEKTGDELYLAKAVALANNMTQIQQRCGGRYRTWWQKTDGGWQQDWINCTHYDAVVMHAFGTLCAKLDESVTDLHKKPLALLLSSPPQPAIIQELVRRYQQCEESALRCELLNTIALQSSDAARPLILKAVQSKDAELRAAATALLGGYDDAKAKNLLQNTLMHGPQAVRSAAVHAGLQLAGTMAEANRPEADQWRRLALLHASDPAMIREALLDMEDKTDDPLVVQKNAEMKTRFQTMAQKFGFVVHWHLAGPFPLDNNTLHSDHVSSESIDLSQPLRVGTKTMSWSVVSADNIQGILHLSDWFGSVPGVVYACAEMILSSPQAAQFKLGSNDGVTVWLNGVKIHHHSKGRVLAIDEDRINVNLAQGRNSLLLRIMNLGGVWQACLRICDEQGMPMDCSRWPELSNPSQKK